MNATTDVGGAPEDPEAGSSGMKAPRKMLKMSKFKPRETPLFPPPPSLFPSAQHRNPLQGVPSSSSPRWSHSKEHSPIMVSQTSTRILCAWEMCVEEQ